MRIVGEAILKRELLSILRSPRAFAMLGVYVAALGAVTLLAWPTGEFDVIYQAERSRKLFLLVSIAQFVLVTLLAPVFAAGALTQEKEKKCMELLLTTPFSADDISVGKFLSSVVYLALLVLSSLPILMLCFFLGGVFAEEVAGLFLVLLGTSATFGMVGLTCSSCFSRTYASLAVSYLVVLPVAAVVLAIFGGGGGGGIRLPGLGEGVSIAVIGCAAVLGMGLAVVRRLEDAYSDVEKSAEQERPERQSGLVLRKGSFPDSLIWPERSGDLLEDGKNPMVLKEISSEVFGRGSLVVRTLILLSCVVSIGFLWTCFHGSEPAYIAYLLAFNLLVTPAFACNAFTQERERGTLDLLLTTLLTPWQIVRAKFYAAVRVAGALTLYLSVPCVLGVLFSLMTSETRFEVGELFIHAGVVAATIAAAAAVGLYISCRSRTSLAAMVATYASCFVLFALPVIGYAILETTEVPSPWFSWLLAASPFSVAYSVGDAEWQREQLGMALERPLWPAYVGGYAALAAALVCLTWLRLERYALGRPLRNEKVRQDEADRDENNGGR